MIGIVYHTGIVKPSEAPKSLEDLVKPQYHGKVVMPDPASTRRRRSGWPVCTRSWAKEKADKFIHDFAATKPLLVPSLTPAGERITTGETPIGIAFLKNVVFYGKHRRAAGLRQARANSWATANRSRLAAKGPHANAGKAFIDYFLGEESLKIMANIGEFVTRKGIYPPLPDANKIQLVDMIDMDKEGYARRRWPSIKRFSLQN